MGSVVGVGAGVSGVQAADTNKQDTSEPKSANVFIPNDYLLGLPANELAEDGSL